ncbi:MAG: hypothetical protein HFE39_10315 [Clostridiales bacterium]|jgi:hypothetical protein|nr:hypothetical protein [Clostridiales bacterium]
MSEQKKKQVSAPTHLVFGSFHGLFPFRVLIVEIPFLFGYNGDVSQFCTVTNLWLNFHLWKYGGAGRLLNFCKSRQPHSSPTKGWSYHELQAFCQRNPGINRRQAVP